MQYLDTTLSHRSPAVDVSSRRHSEVFPHGCSSLPRRRRAVLTAENTDYRSHVCSSGVALVGFRLVPVGSMSIKMLSRRLVTLSSVLQSLPAACRVPLWTSAKLFFFLPSSSSCLQPVDGVQRTVLECLSLTHAIGLHSLYALCRRWVLLLPWLRHVRLLDIRTNYLQYFTRCN